MALRTIIGTTSPQETSSVNVFDFNEVFRQPEFNPEDSAQAIEILVSGGYLLGRRNDCKQGDSFDLGVVVRDVSDSSRESMQILTGFRSILRVTPKQISFVNIAQNSPVFSVFSKENPFDNGTFFIPSADFLVQISNGTGIRNLDWHPFRELEGKAESLQNRMGIPSIGLGNAGNVLNAMHSGITILNRGTLEVNASILEMVAEGRLR